MFVPKRPSFGSSLIKCVMCDALDSLVSMLHKRTPTKTVKLVLTMATCDYTIFPGTTHAVD